MDANMRSHHAPDPSSPESSARECLVAAKPPIIHVSHRPPIVASDCKRHSNAFECSVDRWFLLTYTAGVPPTPCLFS